MYNTLLKLRILSHNWSDEDKLYKTLTEAKKNLRLLVSKEDAPNELFKVYDLVVVALFSIDSEELCDCREFSSVLTDFGFIDFTRDDYLGTKNHKLIETYSVNIDDSSAEELNQIEKGLLDLNYNIYDIEHKEHFVTNRGTYPYFYFSEDDNEFLLGKYPDRKTLVKAKAFIEILNKQKA